MRLNCLTLFLTFFILAASQVVQASNVTLDADGGANYTSLDVILAAINSGSIDPDTIRIVGSDQDTYTMSQYVGNTFGSFVMVGTSTNPDSFPIINNTNTDNYYNMAAHNSMYFERLIITGTNGFRNGQSANTFSFKQCIIRGFSSSYFFYADGNTNTNVQFINCLFQGNSINTGLINLSFYGGTPTLNIFNCTFDNNAAVFSSDNSYNTNFSIKNCIFSNNSSIIYNNPSTYNIRGKVTNSLTSESTTGYGGSCVSNSDPKYVSSSRTKPSDWKINSTSPAKDIGTSTGAPTNDLANISRTGTFDAGCFEYVPTVIPAVTWDVSTSAGYQGGSGTWGTNNYWSSDGTTLIAWPGAGSSAKFAGSDGTYAITVNGTQSVDSIRFSNSGYTLSNGTLTIGATRSITVDPGKTATINSAIAGTNVVFGGGGTITIGGTNTNTGNDSLCRNTTVIFANSNAAGPGGKAIYAVDSGARIKLSGGISFDNAKTFILSGDSALRNAGGANVIQGSLFAVTGAGNPSIIVDSGTLTINSRVYAGANREMNFGGVANGTINGVIGANIVNLYGVDYDFSGNIISIRKSNSGTWIFTATNIYTGPTTIAGGELRITGSTVAASAVSVLSGATLSGTGNIAGTVTVNSGGILAPGNGGVGKLKTGAMTINGTSVLNYELGTTSDTIAVTGNLTLDGTINISALAGFGYGTYTILTYTGTLTDNGLTVGTVPAGYTATVNAGSNAVTLTVKQNQTISFGTWTGKVYGDADFSSGATATSGLAITSYSSSDPTVATISAAGLIHVVAVGTTTITATQAGNANYNAAPNATQDLTVGKANQTITFGALAGKVYNDADYAPGATSSSGLTVAYSSSNTSVATIVAGQIHIVAPGTSTITASQAGNASYNAATNATQTLTVGKADQTITFNALPGKVYGDANFDPGATASSGLSITSYTSSNTGVATIVAGQIHVVGVGTSTITATQSGNANYNAAVNATQTLTVGKANQTITFNALPGKTFNDADFGPGATASSGLAVAYSSSNTAVATIVSNQIHIIGAGTSTITASQAGDGNYNAAVNATQTLTVGKANQTITFGALPSKLYGASDFAPGATASSGGAVSYTSSDISVATIVSGQIHITGVGTSTITASQAGTANYNAAADVQQTLTVTSTDYKWDISVGAGFQSGSGTWGSDNYWSVNGTTLSAWPGGGNNAIFAGSNGSYTVTLNGVQSVDTVTFSNTGYVLTGGTLNLPLASPSIKADVDATISSTITAASGFTKNGSGNLTVNAGYSGGAVTLNAGTLTLGTIPADGFSAGGSGITINNGATLKLSTNGLINNSTTINVVSGGTLNLNSKSESVGYAYGAGQIINGSDFTMDLADGVSKTFSGVMSSGSLYIRGKNSTSTAGTLVITGVQTYTGITGITATSSTTSNNSKAILQLAGGNNRLSSSTVISFGNATNTGLNGKLILGDGSSASDQTVAGLTDASGTGTFAVVGGNAAVSTLTVSNSTDYSFSGILGGIGANENKIALVKTGTGVLTLAGVNTYTGTTTLTNGTLKIMGSTSASSAVTVQTGATLSGSGNVSGSITVNNGGILSPGNAGAGTLNTGALVLNNTSVLNYELGTSSDAISVTGALTLDGTLNVSSLAGFSYGTYTLITYSGALTNNGLNIGTIPSGYTAAISAVGGSVTLTVKQNQTITFNALPGKSVGDANFAPGASSTSGLAISYTSSDPLVATIVGGQIHIVGPGSTTITASQAGDANFNAAVNATQVLSVGKGDQTITFNALAAQTYTSGDFAPGATSTSGLTVTYTSSNLSVATIVGGNIHIVGVGASTITASQSGDANYNAAIDVNQTLTVGKASQSITFNALGGKVYTDADFSPGASSSSGLTVSYTSSDLTVATIVAGQIHIVGVGTSTITASQVGDAHYSAAVNATQLLTVNKANQTITFGVLPGKNVGNADFSPGATSSSGLAVDYTSSAPGVVTIVASNIHVVGVGTSTITASQPGDAHFNAAVNVTQDITVGKGNQTITFPALPAKVCGDADFTPGATASSGLGINYTSSNPAVATIVGGQIHIIGAGTSTITASQPGDVNYNAAVDVTRTLTVSASTFTWDNNVAAGYQAGDGIWGTNIYWSNNGTDLVAWPGAGNNARFAGSNGAYSITVNGTQAVDTLEFSSTGYVLSGGSINLTNTPVIKSGVDATIGSVLTGSNGMTKEGNGTLTLTDANNYTGNTVIDAGTLQIGNNGATGVLPGDVTNNSTLTFNRSNAYTYNGVISGSGTVVKKGTGALSIGGINTYSGLTTVDDGTLVIPIGGSVYNVGNAAGTIVINNGGTVRIDRNDFFGIYTSTPVASITINSNGVLASNSSFNTINNLTLNGGTLNSNGGLDATWGSFSLKGTVTVTGTSISAISNGGGSDNQVMIGTNNAGGVTTFNVADNTVGTDLSVSTVLSDNRNAGSVTVASGLIKSGNGSMLLSEVNTYTGTTTVSAGTLEITGSTSAGSAVAVQSGATISGTGNVSGAVTVNNGGIVSPGSSGAGTITTGALALNNTSILNFELGTLKDKIVTTGNLTLDGTINVSAVAGFDHGTYTILSYGTLLSDNGLTIGSLPAGYTATISTGAGEVVLNVKSNQTIAFGVLPGKDVGDADFDPGATASSGLAVSYSSNAPAVATIVSGKIHIVGVGTATITASQAGDGNYNSALDATQTITIGKGDQVITFGALPGKNFGDGDFAPGGSASSGLPISYTSSNTAVATIIAGQIHIVGVGSSTITASQTGNVNYNAAVDVQQTLSIGKSNQSITFNALPGEIFGDADFAPGATASSGLTVEYASSDPSVATIVARQIHIVGAGTATITASQAGNGSYNAAADVPQTLTVNAKNQTITFGALPGKDFGDADFDPGATSTSGLAVTYSSSDGAVASIVGGNIHIVGVGTSTITASQIGNTNYNAAADVTQVLTVGQADQTISFVALPIKNYGDADFAPGATASSTLAVLYASSNPAVATIVAGNIHIVGVGTSTITASQAGDGHYTAAVNVTQDLTVNKAGQTITFGALPGKIFGDADFNAGASASSGLSVSYSSSNLDVATINGTDIHIVGVGSSTITASQSGNENYTTALDVTQTLNVSQKTQTITFNALAGKVYGDIDFAPGATASSGLDVSYTSSDLSVATIVNGKIHIVSAGTTTITASQTGNTNYSAAVNATQVLNVIKADQSITFGALPAKKYGNSDFSPLATTSSGLAVSYTSSDLTVATIVGTDIHIVGVGTSTITAIQAGDARYNAAVNVTQVLTVNKADQTITFGSLPAKNSGDADFAPGATASSGLAVSYTSSDLGVATIVGTDIHIVGVGTSTITAMQTGDAHFEAAANATQQLNVGKGTQTITFNALPGKVFTDADFAPGATITSGLPITYTSDDPTVATIVAGKIHIVGIGTVTITASQPGDVNFQAATDVQQLLTISTANQTITFNALPGKSYTDADFSPGATASSGLAVIYTSSNSGVATITGDQIHIVGAGASTITASQPGNSRYNAAADVQQLLTVNKAGQTITFNPLPAKVSEDVDFTPGASSTSGLDITYSSSDITVATIVDNQIHIIGVGTSTITASQAGNANYDPAIDVSRLLTIGQSNQTITFDALPTKNFGDADFAPGATASSLLPVLYTSSNLSVATIVANQIHIVGVGSSTITASQAGNANYNAALDVTQVLTVDKANQTITFAALPVKEVDDIDFAPGASVSSGLQISYASSDLTVATIAGSDIHITGVGQTTITASQAGDGHYNSATDVTQILTVNALSQTITFNALPAKLYQDADFAPGATASSGLTVSYTSSDLTVATIVGGQIHIVGGGTTTITASQPGNATYYGAPTVDQVLTVGRINQTITFGSLPAKNYGDADFSPGATTSSGLAVSYTSSDPTVAAIVAGQIHIAGSGTSTITASQPGDLNYNAAVNATQVLTVGKADQTITFGALPLKNFGDADFAPGATASSGLVVSYTSSDSTVATIVAGQIHIVGGGSSTITAFQAGDANYNAAIDATQLLTIGKANQTITFGALPIKTLNDPDFLPGAISSSGLPVIYTSSDHSIATIVAGQIHILKAGTATITASQSGNVSFFPALDVAQVFTVSKLNQTISFAVLPAKALSDSDFAPGATSSSGLTVTYTSSDSSVATIVAGQVHIVGVGSTTITASQAGDTTFNPALDVTQVLNVGKLNQTITFDTIPVKNYGDTDFVPTALSTSGLLVTYTSSDSTVAKIVSGKIHIVKSGVSTITASQPGDTRYLSAIDVLQIFTVGKKTLTIKADDKTRNYMIQNPSLTWSASGFVPGEGVSVLDTLPSATTNATIDSSVGTYTISLLGGSDNNYNIVRQSGVFTITKSAQSINFGTLANHISSETSFKLSSVASSGLPVTFGSLDSSRIRINNDTAYINDTGCVTLAAHQSGNMNYDSAQTVLQNVCILPEVLDYPIVIVNAADRIDQSLTPTLIWHKVGRASAYHVQVSINNTISSTVYDTTVSDTSITAKNLARNTTYYWHVSSINKFSTSLFCPVDSFKTIPQIPAIPDLIVSESDRIDQSLTPKLRWKKVASANSYRIQISTDNIFANPLVDSIIPDTGFVTDSLELDTTYYWHVLATNAGGSSPFSLSDSFKTIAQTLATPIILTIIPDTIRVGTTIALDWENVVGATYYKFEMSKDSTFTIKFRDTLVRDSSSIVLSDLENDKTYYWHVDARSEHGRSKWSSTEHFTTMLKTSGDLLTATSVITSNKNRLTPELTINCDTLNSAWRKVITVTQEKNNSSLINMSPLINFSRSSITTLNKPIDMEYKIPSISIEGKPIDKTLSQKVRAYYLNDSNQIIVIYNYKFDSTGNIIVSLDTLKTIFFAIDTIPPSISDNSSRQPKVSGFIPTISGTCRDNIQNAKYMVYFRKGGSAQYDSLPITADKDQVFSCLMGNKAAIDSSGMEYYLTAYDGTNKVTLERQNFSTLILNITSKNEFPNMKWYLFASPMQLQNDTIGSLFSSLGEYGKMWRMYSYDNTPKDTLIEFNNGLNKIEPGKTYWVKTRKEKSLINIASGTTYPVNTCYTVQVPARKWIAISNPFLFSVDWENVLDSSHVNETALIGPYAYDDSAWIPPNKINKLEPWIGYYIFNNTDTVVTLRIPSLSNKSMLAKKSFTENNLVFEWEVHGTNGSDYKNYFGINSSSSDDYDPSLDFPKPVSPDAGVRTYFNRPAFKKVAEQFQTDFTKLVNGGASWNISIQKMQPSISYFCHIEGIKTLPDSLEAWLLDIATGNKWDIRTSDYGVTTIKANDSLTLKLVIGTPAYIQKYTSNFKLVLFQFMVSQNYPNPVRNYTRINYTIPYDITKLRVPVSLSIFTMAGRKVATIQEQPRSAGFYTISLDVSSPKLGLSAGTYVYKLSAGKNWKSHVLQVIR